MIIDSRIETKFKDKFETVADEIRSEYELKLIQFNNDFNDEIKRLEQMINGLKTSQYDTVIRKENHNLEIQYVCYRNSKHSNDLMRSYEIVISNGL